MDADTSDIPTYEGALEVSDTEDPPSDHPATAPLMAMPESCSSSKEEGDMESPSTPMSQSEKSAEVSRKTSKQGKAPSRQLSTEVAHFSIDCSHIIEYEWPPKSGDRYFIQEQISLLLDVKSFKRKYPDLVRRVVEPDERTYLMKELNLGSCIAPHMLNHLTALNAGDVHDLMSTEYPAIYAEYQCAIADRMKQGLINQQKELEVIKSDTHKLDELRRKAMKSAAEFNSELHAVRQSERKHFWDIQTSVIQSPTGRWYKMPKELSRPSPYPCALIPGQYSSHFKRFNQEQLRKCPFNVVVDGEELFPPKRSCPSPPAIHVSEEELQRATPAATSETNSPAEPATQMIKEEDPLAGYEQQNSPCGALLLKRSSTSSSIDVSARRTTPQHSGVKKSARLQQRHQIPASPLAIVHSLCSVCGSGGAPSTPAPSPRSQFVKCSECQQEMHPACIDMPQSMVPIVQKYAWCCIDCKTCAVCSKPDQEDAMMCCDICDRGYHTFCVDLDEPPNGPWMCPNCQV